MSSLFKSHKNYGSTFLEKRSILSGLTFATSTGMVPIPVMHLSIHQHNRNLLLMEISQFPTISIIPRQKNNSYNRLQSWWCNIDWLNVRLYISQKVQTSSKVNVLFVFNVFMSGKVWFFWGRGIDRIQIVTLFMQHTVFRICILLKKISVSKN